MKKLIIAAAITCAAVSVQAAATMWSASTGTGQYWKDGYKQADGGTYTAANLANGVAVYMIAATHDVSGSGVAISQANLVKAFQSSTTESPFSLSSYKVAGSSAGATKNGKVYGSNSAIAAFTNADDFTGGTTYDFYLAAIVTYGGKDYLYVTDSVSKAAGNESTTTSITSFLTTNSSKVYKGGVAFDGAGWYAAVPEPTSGLMLLLGVGLMALRRRRA